MLMLGQTTSIPVVSKVLTIILGMGALFGFLEQSDVPSIAAMGSPDNVLHGTVIDNKVCHPKNSDFYLGTHAGMIGITRQTHYHVLLDQAGFLADDLQEFVHFLSYMYHRSTTAIFVVAPICYTHLAPSQLGAIYED
ncbi:Protein argonaute 4 -like protein [Gossypium arboreum]|uniref:Protein argonaute 4-like protein n=1 Tax=Gossypium arboreum TaxID=29729 RepID=A0A0B0NGK2_GOSAR|nr:Protein argonaute 4 -like protein [Gossypium arboreum]